MLFVIVLDSSSQMSQRTKAGITFLDAAKAGIEHLIKLRQRGGQADKYTFITYKGLQLLTCEDTDMVLNAVKQVQAVDASSGNDNLGLAFHTLNQERLQNNLDSFGYGRKPWQTLPATVLFFTHAAEYVSGTRFSPSPQPAPGSDLYQRPYRWDQRLFVFLLRADIAPALDECSRMCDDAGGRCLHTPDLKSMLFQIERLQQYLPQGPMIELELRPVPEVAAQKHARVVISQRSKRGEWPLPEDQWPDRQLQVLARRATRPTLIVDTTRVAHESSLAQFCLLSLAFPCDIYDVQRSTVTDRLYAMSLAGCPPCWPVYNKGSAAAGKPEQAVGFMTMSNEPVAAKLLASIPASQKPPGVMCLLVLLPPEYNTLWHLLRSFVSSAGSAADINHLLGSGNLSAIRDRAATWLQTISAQWAAQFNAYVDRLPFYFQPSLKLALDRLQLSNQVNSNSGGGYNQLLKRSWNGLGTSATAEVQRLQSSAQYSKDSPPPRQASASSTTPSATSSGALQWSNIRNNLFGFCAVHELLGDGPWLVPTPRHDQADPARQAATDTSHCVPIAIMGDYQKVLDAHRPLRDPLEGQLQDDALLFGNPYAFRRKAKGSSAAQRRMKSQMLMVDEAAMLADDTAVQPTKRNRDDMTSDASMDLPSWKEDSEVAGPPPSKLRITDPVVAATSWSEVLRLIRTAPAMRFQQCEAAIRSLADSDDSKCAVYFSMAAAYAREWSDHWLADALTACGAKAQ